MLLSACDKDPNATKLQYMPDMADAPTVKAQEDFLDPPEGSVAMSAILYPANADEAEKQLQNPFAGVPEPEAITHLAQGKVLFETYCAVCHGIDAKGEGYIVDKFPRPPDLAADPYLTRADGFFFYRITFGSAIMPSYGHAISPHERWQIILHLRTLQKAGK
jgi:mono/diheme cytochrome c family protein